MRLTRAALVWMSVAAAGCSAGGEAVGASSSSTSSGASSGVTSSSGASSSSGAPGEVRSLGAASPGIATFYDGIGTKNCGLDDPSDRLFAAARKDTVYRAGAACGTCMRVTGELGSVVLSIIDSCPVNGNSDCGNSGATLDLSPEAFVKIAPKAKGKVNITYEPVSCPTGGPMQYRFKEGSSQYWTAIQVRNHKLPLAKLEYSRGGAWTPMPRASMK